MTSIPISCARGLHPIGALAERFGVSLRTLRFYEEKGLLQPEHRHNQRYYRDRDVARLRIILLAKRFGFTILEIRDLIENRIPEECSPTGIRDLRLSRTEIQARIDALAQQRRDIDAAIRELGDVMASTAIASAL